MGHTKCVQNVMLVSQNAQLNCLASVLIGLQTHGRDLVHRTLQQLYADMNQRDEGEPYCGNAM